MADKYQEFAADVLEDQAPALAPDVVASETPKLGHVVQQAVEGYLANLHKTGSAPRAGAPGSGPSGTPGGPSGVTRK